MQYNDYEAEDFLLDESFRNYCLGKNDKDVNFWEAWIAAHPGKLEETRQAKELYFLLNGNIQPGHFNGNLQQFQSMLEKHIVTGNREADDYPVSHRKKSVGKRILMTTAAVAATVLAIFYIPRLLPAGNSNEAPLQYEYTQTSKAGERKSFQLPDGSKVMLNAGSTIDIAQQFNEETREITLEGEAFFDVAHNPQKPFIIHTSSMDVRVLGTAFNIKAYPGDKISETSLLRGSVEITLKNNRKKKIILRPNEKIVLPNVFTGVDVKKPESQPDVTEKPPYTIAGLTYVDSSLVEISWTQNQLVFNDNNFEEIATELERWYNVSIHFGDEVVKEYRYTAKFDQKNITQILDALQLSRHFTYKIEEDNKIIIRNR